MKLKRLGATVIAIGALLFLVGTFGAVGSLAALGPLSPELLVAVGAALYLYDRYGGSLPGSTKTAELSRQDVIASTNWSRENKHQIRKSIGVGLLTAGLFAWVLSTVLGLGSIERLWLAVAGFGAVLVGLSWRLSRGIKADYTREVSVRLPDQIALHTFHVRLRQFAEDKGYAIVSETSPSEGGRSAAFDEKVWLSHGSFKARQRPVAESRALVPEVEDDPYLSKLLTAITVGFVVIVTGISLTQVQPDPTATDPNMALYDGAHFLGGLFVLVGIALVAYGYIRRTREWGEIYCVEEGTVYGSDLNLYDEETVRGFESHVTPNVSAPDSACELVVTLGATCTSLYDERRLEEDLQSLADEVETLAETQRHEFFGDDDRSIAEDPSERESSHVSRS